jgi:hypothetical protein
MPGRTWTDKEDEDLTDLYLDRIPVDEIADHMSRTISAVSQRVTRLGLSRPREITPDLRAKLSESIKASWDRDDGSRRAATSRKFKALRAEERRRKNVIDA